MDKKNRILEILLRISRKVSSSLELGKVTEMILREARSTLKADYSGLFLMEEDSGELILAGANGFKSKDLKNLEIMAAWEEINKKLAKNPRAIIVNDIDKSVQFKKERLPLKSFLAVPLKTESGVIGVLVASNGRGHKAHFTEEDKKLLYALANNVSIALLNAKLYADTKNAFLKTIASLVAAVDAKDPYTHGHSERVAKYAVAIGKEMKLPPVRLENLRLSGLLHDIGKIGISDNILGKKSALDEEERKLINRHPQIGLKIVESVIESRGVIAGISQHHERFDGSGYPGRVKGKDILPEGRIIAVADTFDTLTTERPYKKAYTAKEALLEITRSAKTHFDPKVVKAFQKSFSDHPELWNVR